MTHPPHITAKQASAALALGVTALLILGLQPLVLGILTQENRLTDSQIGLAATLEMAGIGIASGLCGAFMPLTNIRRNMALACVAHAAANLATMYAAGNAIVATRFAAGLCAGVMLWAAIGTIARSANPHRLSGIFFTTQTLAQLAVAALMSALIVPRAGANGTLGTLAVLSLASIAACLAGPGMFAAVQEDQRDGAPAPFAGLAGLASVFLFMAGIVAVWVYLEPLAARAGIAPGSTGIAVSAGLGFQVLGGLAATVLGTRLRLAAPLLITLAAACAVVMELGHPGPERFVLFASLFGFFWLFALPFQTALLIRIDPTRRIAMQIGTAQLLGSAAGPMAASLLAGGPDLRPVLWLSTVCLAACLLLTAAILKNKYPAPPSMRT